MGRSIEAHGERIVIDDDWYSNFNEIETKRSYELNKLGIDLVRVKLPAFYHKALFCQSIPWKIIRHIPTKLYREKKVMSYDPKVLTVRNRYIYGYFQTEKYFQNISDKIKNEIKFQGVDYGNGNPSSMVDNSVMEMANQINCTNAVSIHIRLGDYLKFSDRYGNCATIEYYHEAMKYIHERVENPVFYLFSNDIPQAMKLFEKEKVVPVNMNFGDRSYLDMYLMSQCRYNIIANSSFSWWGAWLNDRKGKIVIAPRKWLNNVDTPDIWANGWIRL